MFGETSRQTSGDHLRAGTFHLAWIVVLPVGLAVWVTVCAASPAQGTVVTGSAGGIDAGSEASDGGPATDGERRRNDRRATDAGGSVDGGAGQGVDGVSTVVVDVRTDTPDARVPSDTGTPSRPVPAPPGVSSVGAAPERKSDDDAGERRKLPLLGLGIDLGVSGVLPDAGLLLALRPYRWAHGQLGPGYNGIALGIRGGVTLISPIAFPLSVTLEGGHYFEGDANRVVHWFNSETKSVASLRHFSYDYLNLLGGLVIEGRRFSFYVRGGVTWMRSTVANLGQSVNEAAQVDLQAADLKIHYRGPSAKLGLIVFP
jgi:hypothetical protein